MKKVRKHLLFPFTLLLLVAAIGYFGWVALQLDNYKTLVTEQIEKATGRHLTIRGHIEMTFGEHPTLSFTDIALTNASWSKTPTALIATRLSIQFDLKALLHRQLRLETITLDNAKMLLERNPQGVSNWQFTFPPTTKTPFFTISRPLQINIILNNYQVNIRHSDRSLVHIMLKKAKINLNGETRNLNVQTQGLANNIAFQTKTQIIYPLIIKKGIYNIKSTTTVNTNQLTLTGTYNNTTPDHQANFKINAQGKNFADLLGLFGVHYLPTDHYQLQTDVQVNKRLLQFNNMNAQMLEGNITGHVYIDFRPVIPLYDFDLIGKKLDAGTGMKALGLSKKFDEGTLYLHYQIKTSGYHIDDFLSHQNGTITLSLSNTYYSNPSLAVYTQKLFQLLSGGSSSQAVNFHCFVTRLICTEGLCKIKGLAFNTPGANVVGKGLVNMQDHSMRLLIIPISKVINLNPLALPMVVSGPFNNPSVSPATKALTKQLLGDLFNVVTGQSIINFLTAGLTPAASPNDPSFKACLGTLSNFKQANKMSLTNKLVDVIYSLNPLNCKNIYGPLGRKCSPIPEKNLKSELICPPGMVKKKG